jgi:hypothetical protein
MAKESGPVEGKHPLDSVYINLAFLGSHVERARKTMKELKGRWDLEKVLKYSDDQFGHIEYCVNDLSGKVMKYIQEGDL